MTFTLDPLYVVFCIGSIFGAAVVILGAYILYQKHGPDQDE